MGNDNLDFASAIGIRLGIDTVRDVQEYIDRAAALAKKSDVAVVVVGMNNEWESEGYDRHTMALPGKQNELIEAVIKANPSTIVVNQSGCPITMPWLDRVPAVLQAWYQGQEAGNALADVLLGKVNPSGRLPITFPKRLEDNPSFGNFGDGGEKNQINYTEGVYVGYRHYNTRDIPVLFPFGFGLSYTSFEVGAPTVDEASFAIGKKITVEVPVKNTGAIKGIETIQAYLAPKKSAVDRPKRELKGFAKIELEAGESGVAKIELDHYAPGLFCEEKKCWRALEGRYVVEVLGFCEMGAGEMGAGVFFFVFFFFLCSHAHVLV
jgi:beta-glucosidase